jgi:UTP-glucose-1-phosphate uridylyltransferase/mevalonate kinase
MSNKIYDLFVPGRLCLFGEHSDWAGAYRRFNAAIAPGQVILAGTNQGIHARVRALSGQLKLRSRLPDGSIHEACYPMQRKALQEAAARGGFFSYAAGVAHFMLTFYQVDGLELDNYQTSMPVKKGLSSSAAFCVLVARAFGYVYDLKMTARAEMEAAYQGEILTPSRCGRMDQGCAFGSGAVRMTFDADSLHTKRLKVGAPIYLLAADLQGKKDTIRILADLTKAYPFPSSEQDRAVQHYLGELNTEIVEEAVALLAKGDAKGLGELMSRAQELFDQHVAPACPAELAAPRLHAVLADATLRRLSYGGKGVGSQGDGCVQIVARGQSERNELAAYLQQQYGLDCYPLDLMPPKALRKAVIPAAGLGTRMFPVTKAIKKEMFPVVTPDGVCKPIIQTIIEEAIDAGAEEIAIIVRPEDEKVFADYFAPVSDAYYERLPEAARQQSRVLAEIGQRLSFIHQQEALGFGHAIYCAKDWVGEEPFLLLLGDHIYSSRTAQSCAAQLLEAYSQHGRKSIVSLYPAAASDVHHYGTVTGQWVDEQQQVLELSQFAEKPSLSYAREQLVTPGLGEDRFLCIYGQYILNPDIFTILGRHIAEGIRQRGEIQLTAALEVLRAQEGMLGFLVDGNHYDTGQPFAYLQSLQDYGRPSEA